MKTDPFSLLFGLALYHGIKKNRRLLRRLGVLTTSQLFNTLDRSRELAAHAKEELEDIVAEARYESSKKRALMEAEKGQRRPNDGEEAEGGPEEQ